ncbi:hypothetical protein [Nocardia miyunensis]|uniref:hypothetical protein n=1 Tax=Nocardia miyunensis TaxID=282684 RepID=UPI00082D1BA5|nr:hypothetical protein [Nocardia miyunensis]
MVTRAAAGVDGPASTLIDELGPLLDTQTVTGDRIRQWASSLAALTGTLRTVDAHLRGVIAQAGPAADEVTALFTRLRPTLPLLLSNLVTVEQVAAVHNPSLQQILVLYPPLIAAPAAAVPAQPAAAVTTYTPTDGSYVGGAGKLYADGSAPEQFGASPPTAHPARSTTVKVDRDFHGRCRCGGA